MDDPGLSAIFYPGGQAAAVGTTVRQPALARTLRSLADAGPSALYGGEVGRAYARGLAVAGSPITIEDLAAHEASLLAPLRAAFGDLHVSVAPPMSQGFVLLQLLMLLERLGIDPDLDGEAAGPIARVIDVANMGRDRHLADPDRMLVHPSTLLDDGHLAALADQARDAAPARARPDGDTIALVAADAEGNAVSLIQSLFWGFGSGSWSPRRASPRRTEGRASRSSPDIPTVSLRGCGPSTH